ncbi:MAG: TIGR00730 family Rossman fold protein, partial [Gemmatimonadota bacterium]
MEGTEGARAGSGGGAPRVAVFGSGGGGEVDLARARRLGAGLARAGYVVMNGGYGGTMEAAAAGASEAG